MSNFCKNCGTRLNGEAYCPKCQRPATPDHAVSENNNPAKKHSLFWRCAVGMGIAIGFVFVISRICSYFGAEPVPVVETGSLSSVPNGWSESESANDAQLDIDWILGFSIGDSAEKLGFRFTEQDYPYSLLYRASPKELQGLIPRAQKGWGVTVGATPHTKKIYNVLAGWTVRYALDTEHLDEEELEEILEPLRTQHHAKDIEDLAVVLTEKQYGEILSEMTKRFGVPPVNDRQEIAKTLPSALTDCFLTARRVMDADEGEHIHLFQRENRYVYLACCLERGNASLGVAVLDRDLLRKAMLEAKDSSDNN